MRKSGADRDKFRGRSDSAGSVSAGGFSCVPSTSFVKRRQFLFLNLKKRSSFQDEMAVRGSVSLPGSPSHHGASIFYQPLDPPQRPLR